MCCVEVSRRDFVKIMPAAAVAAPEGKPWASDRWDPRRALRTQAKALTVQPVLMYATPERKEQTSWKSWGGVQTDAAAEEEAGRIAGELRKLAATAVFGLEILPVLKVKSPEGAARARQSASDATVIYPATGSGTLLRSLIAPERDTILFVRHRSGPVYYWYEALSARYLKSAETPRLTVDDVVVDEARELEWRLRSLWAAKNTRATRIVALGGARGKYAGDAPKVARERFGFDIVEAGYDDFEKRIRGALADSGRVTLARKWTEQYLAISGTVLDTKKEFVVNAFVLYGAFLDLMEEAGAEAFTIGSCMGTIMPMAETTACLTLSFMNDEGIPAFCESDFVIIPAGVLLRYVAGQPVFLHNSTFPHNAMVTCAHCTGPRRMNGVRYEPARLVTHYESEYGAAPKVEMPKGQEVTFLDPEYATARWVGMRGIVESNPFYEICRSQQDVRILGDWKKLLHEARDSHWVMVYGNCLKEAEYAARRFGVTVEMISET